MWVSFFKFWSTKVFFMVLLVLLYFRFLIMSSLGVPACFLICAWWIPKIHLWCDTCWPLSGKTRSQAFFIAENVSTRIGEVQTHEWERRSRTFLSFWPFRLDYFRVVVAVEEMETCWLSCWNIKIKNLCFGAIGRKIICFKRSHLCWHKLPRSMVKALMPMFLTEECKNTKKPVTKCYPSEHWTWDLSHLHLMHVLLGTSKSKIEVMQEQRTI